MKPLNALDALAPAFTRTHQVLLQPFRVGRSWKLAATAYVAFAGSLFLPWPLMVLLAPLPFGSRAAAAVILLIPTVLLLLIFYLGVRMQSVHFEMVVTKAKFIAPMWRRYGSSSWPWLLLKAALGTVVGLAATPLLISRFRQVFHAIPALAASIPKPDPGVAPDPVATQQAMMGVMGQMIEVLLPLYLIMFLIFLVLKLFGSLLEDFCLPFAILDEVPMFEAIRRGFAVIAADPLQVILYLLGKFIMSILGYFALNVATQLVMIPIFLIAGIIGAIAGFVTMIFESANSHHVVALAVGLGVGGTIAFFIAFWVLIFGFGYMLTLLEAYAIYFLGGRYPRLGDYLEPPVYTYAPPPMPPSVEEDHDDGPSLPMDPALA